MKVKHLAIRPTKKRTPAAIMIWQAGYGLKDFAAVYGCSVVFISQVVNGLRRSERLEMLIAATLGHSAESLFSPAARRKGKVAA